MKQKKRWSAMTKRQRVAVVVLGVVQVSLLLAAATDLARRPAEQIRGEKRVWAGIIGINYVGPIAYFVRGRRK